MSYGRFAYYYDALMEDAPYSRWAEFAIKAIGFYGPKQERTLLDLGCGTGELSIRFAKDGFSVTGVDLSPEMLSVASSKAEEERVRIRFFEQDMSELDVPGQFGLCGIFCDSLNYLSSEEDVTSTFRRILDHLVPGGLLVFDVHSIHKVVQGFLNHSFSLNGDEVAYIWDSFEGEHPYSVEHEISFFVLDEKSGKYDRFDEVHAQRTFPVETYTAWLQEAGFEVLDIGADFDFAPPSSESERIFFIAKKPLE
ncbi:methyltransferase [Bacillus sp. FJAT-27225]|uniref:class I SAM-dependent DNA methyltransferase n=1 Tax=Bacillus sp. FJAT-27225 TaxID=1743144 RepID=UPI00080C2A23|nr:class I SAM-dependent methyltransferase [Bacillus sp. FJAT-27225]OCA91177.1 methyltransferase [Bacillus sp. FJAT-27225]